MAADIGSKLIKSVSISFGGDITPVWYCKKCMYYKSDSKPPPGTVCGEEIKTFSYDLFREAWNDYIDQELTDEQIDDLAIECHDHIEQNYDVWTIHKCESTEFILYKSDGQIVDQHDSEWLNIWQELSMPNNKATGYSDMIGKK